MSESVTVVYARHAASEGRWAPSGPLPGPCTLEGEGRPLPSNPSLQDSVAAGPAQLGTRERPHRHPGRRADTPQPDAVMFGRKSGSVHPWFLLLYCPARHFPPGGLAVFKSIAGAGGADYHTFVIGRHTNAPRSLRPDAEPKMFRSCHLLVPFLGAVGLLLTGCSGIGKDKTGVLDIAIRIEVSACNEDPQDHPITATITADSGHSVIMEVETTISDGAWADVPPGEYQISASSAWTPDGADASSVAPGCSCHGTVNGSNDVVDVDVGSIASVLVSIECGKVSID